MMLGKADQAICMVCLDSARVKAIVWISVLVGLFWVFANQVTFYIQSKYDFNTKCMFGFLPLLHETPVYLCTCVCVCVCLLCECVCVQPSGHK